MVVSFSTFLSLLEECVSRKRVYFRYIYLPSVHDVVMSLDSYPVRIRAYHLLEGLILMSTV